MVLPLSLIRTTISGPVLVELKTGEAYSGTLAACDNWMNMHLTDAVLTSKDGDKFVKFPEVYLRGNHVKYLRVPEQVINVVKDEALKASQVSRGGRGRGGAADNRGGNRSGDRRDHQRGQRGGYTSKR